MAAKLRACILLIFVIAGILITAIPARPSIGAETVCGTLATDKGQLKQTVNVPSDGTYTMWLRMLAPSADADSVFVQVDGKCVVVAGDSRLGDGFQWVNYREGNTDKKLTFDLTAGSHTVVVAGREVGTGLDRVVLINGNCKPLGAGNNCLAAATVTANNDKATGKAALQKEISTHAQRWVLILCTVAILVAAGLLAWRYWHCRKHHGVFGSARPDTDVQAVVGHGGPTPLSRALHDIKAYASHHRLFVSICAGIIGAALVTGAVAAANNDQPIFEAETSTLTGGVKIIDHAGASGGKYIVFELNGTPGTVGVSQSSGGGSSSAGSGGSSSGGSSSGDSTSGGGTGSSSGSTGNPYPDRFSVGAPGVAKYRQSDASLPIPAGYTELFPSDGSSKAYNMYNCSGVTNLNKVYIHAFIYVGTGCHGTINITNSIIAPPPGSNQRAILVNADNSASLTINISDTTIRPEPVPLGGTNDALTDHVLNDCETCSIHMNRVDVANSGGMCLCGKNTVIENSWLHDNYIAHLPDPTVAHTGGVFPYGGSGPLEIRYNRLEPGVNAYTGVEVANYWKAITAVLFTQSSGGTMLRNYKVHHNFISLGGFNMGLENGENLLITDNVFGPNHFGYTTTCSSGCSVSIASWTNNFIGDISGKPSATLLPKPF